LDEKARQIRNMFSAISLRYDMLNHLLSLNIDRRWRRKTVSKTTFPPPQRILDLCAGTADLALEYLKAINSTDEEKLQVVALDFSPQMLSHGARKAKRQGLERKIAFTEGDASILPFPDNSFDLCAVAFGLRNVVQWQTAIAEMARVVRPGGKIAILEFSTPPRGILRRLYLLYFLRILPFIGNLISKSRAYQYLPDTVMAWPEPEQLRQAMLQAGLKEVHCHPLTFGIACLHIGVA